MDSRTSRPRRRLSSERGASRIGTWISPAAQESDLPCQLQAACRPGSARSARCSATTACGSAWNTSVPRPRGPPCRYPFIHTMAEMRELIAAIDQPNIGLVLDSWHWYTAHETEADLLALKGSDVICCDLNDAPAGIPTDHRRTSFATSHAPRG